MATKRELKGAAEAEYEKARSPAWAEYRKVHDATLAEYQKVQGPAWAKCLKAREEAFVKYEKVHGPVYAEYRKRLAEIDQLPNDEDPPEVAAAIALLREKAPHKLADDEDED